MLRRYGRALTLLGLIVVQAAVVLVSVVFLLLAFALGMVFLYPPHVRLVRGLAQDARRRSAAWTGIVIDPPYLPEPPPPQPGPDGMYRSDRTLYRTPRIPAWSARWTWMLSDPATWRDGLWLLLDPLIKICLLPLLLVVPGRGLRLYALWCELLLAPTTASRLAGQVTHLNQARNLAVGSQAAEMRRIERDLHDGTQARLVAIGMTLGAAEELIDSDPASARALLAKAREASADTLTELRRVIRGIHPPVLAERGLADAVRALAMDSPLAVSVEVDLPHRPEPPVEAAVYFAVSELLANAARHGDARSATVDVRVHDADLRVSVTDDGLGGADPSGGSGLTGIERRLAAFDGVMAITSPPGGPTSVTMDLPRVLPEHWAGNLPRMPRWKAALVAFLWLTAWCPTFPQGVVAAVFKTFEIPTRSWFLALYLPGPWQWPVILLMIAVGVSMYVLALTIPAAHSRGRWMVEASPRRPGFRA
ncbi:sensor histidine kinase [Nonomuraea muscovyensis]|uniref:sensor histidine kinase n=1 Tax=Nonomuraea muscovyensis TaxID=1124761 RepID=UPI0033D9C7A1|nr:sensor histidine kinase [Nonomuraea muscovyensis]